jgi:putative ABC transport system ATP-binding protein
MSLQLSHVTVTYPDGSDCITALDRVDLQVAPGQLHAVIGPSGSGKSTLLAVAGLLLTPDAGRVVVGGLDATDLSGAARTDIRRQRIGFVFQQSNLIQSLTARDQLRAVGHLAGRPKRATIKRADELLAAVGLTAQSDRMPAQLSGGQRQRVGIARALMNDPAVLLVDEPTSALDAARGRSIAELLAGITRSERVATVIVTHDTSYLDLVDEVSTMHDGRLGSPGERDAAVALS